MKRKLLPCLLGFALLPALMPDSAVAQLAPVGAHHPSSPELGGEVVVIQPRCHWICRVLAVGYRFPWRLSMVEREWVRRVVGGMCRCRLFARTSRWRIDARRLGRAERLRPCVRKYNSTFSGVLFGWCRKEMVGSRRNGTAVLRAKKLSDKWFVYDGQGVTYEFERDTFNNGDGTRPRLRIWLLTQINGVGGSKVDLEYEVLKRTLGTTSSPAGTGVTIDLKCTSSTTTQRMAQRSMSSN